MSFGDVLIPSSRAFWDDCEEDEFNNIKQGEKLQLKFDDEQNKELLSSDLFVIIEGLNISEFCSNCLLKDARRICQIPAKESSLHWNASKKHLIAVVDDDVQKSGEVAQLLIPYAEAAKQVMTITLKPKIDYKSEEINRYSDDLCIIRSIEGNGNPECIEELEVPNFISGVAAGLASWRKQMDLTVSSYAIYVDKLPLDAVSAEPVLKLLRKHGVPCSDRYAPVTKPSSYLYS